MIDSNTKYNEFEKNRQHSERRPQIDVLSLRQSYYLGELDRISWIPENTNPADSLTKPVQTKTSTLYTKMKTNRFMINRQEWATSSYKR